MEYSDYQEWTESMALYPRVQEDPKIVEALYLGNGLSEEAGEVAGHIKKWHRDGKIDRKKVLLEMGDTIWYLSQLCNLFEISITDVMTLNMAKLEDRRDRNKLRGSGSDR